MCNEQSAAPLRNSKMNYPDFYRAFEDRYRGTRELIKSRLQVYRPFVTPLLRRGQLPTVLDLGCGRGEWLELTTEWGFRATGVDVSEPMLETCRGLGLSVVNGDALSKLREVEEESLSVISAFHLVEHLPFDKVQELIEAARRALCPGGLLILETPNPENLVVGTSSFYLDPTHVRPIPPALLGFATQYVGFARNKLVRLHESVTTTEWTGIEDMLTGVSPDYSIVSQKPAEASALRLFDSAFAEEYGISLSTLARRHDEQLKALLQAIDSKAAEALAHSQNAQTLIDEARSLADAEIERSRANARADQLQQEVDRLHSLLREVHASSLAMVERRDAERNEALDRLSEAIASEALATAKMNELAGQANELLSEKQAAVARARCAELDAAAAQQLAQSIYASRSWRLTRPLRWLGDAARSLRQGRRNPAWQGRLKQIVRGSMRSAWSEIKRHPRLHRMALRILDGSPRIKERIKTVVVQATPESETTIAAPDSWLDLIKPEVTSNQWGTPNRQRSPLEAFASKKEYQS